jgi:hypothetical protein
MATYYKVAGNNEPSSYVFGFSNSPKWSIGISRITGADQANPIDVHSGNSGNKSYSAVASSITTTFCNELVLTFYTNKRDANWTAAAGTTEVYDAPNNQNGLTSNMMAYFVQADKGATGSKTATATINEVWVAQQIAIRPAAGRAGANARGNTIAATTSDIKESQPVESAVAEVVGYPNPVRDFLNVTIEGISEQPTASNIMIVDRIGRSYPVKATWEQRNNALQIDLSDLNKGLYLIKVSVSTGTQVLKIYKE